MKKIVLAWMAALLMLTACGQTQEPSTVVEKEPEVIGPVEQLPDAPEVEPVPEVVAPEPQPEEPETVEPPVVSAVDRMRGLDGDDIKYITYDYGCFTMEELAAALAGAAEHEVQPDRQIEAWYTQNIYLSGGSSAWGSDDESFWITAGLEENLVQATYYLPGQEADTRYFSDSTLYWLVRNNYRQDQQVDMEAYEQYGHILCAYAQWRVDQRQGETGLLQFTGYTIPHFVYERTVEMDGDAYEIYNWQPAFLVGEPERWRTVGGEHLDPQGRVCGAEENTFFVVRNPGTDEEEYAFLGWSFGRGADEAAQMENTYEALRQASFFKGES